MAKNLSKEPLLDKRKNSKFWTLKNSSFIYFFLILKLFPLEEFLEVLYRTHNKVVLYQTVEPSKTPLGSEEPLAI